jgi:hypothetical protein
MKEKIAKRETERRRKRDTVDLYEWMEKSGCVRKEIFIHHHLIDTHAVLSADKFTFYIAVKKIFD